MRRANQNGEAQDSIATTIRCQLRARRDGVVGILQVDIFAWESVFRNPNPGSVWDPRATGSPTLVIGSARRRKLLPHSSVIPPGIGPVSPRFAAANAVAAGARRLNETQARDQRCDPHLALRGSQGHAHEAGRSRSSWSAERALLASLASRRRIGTRTYRRQLEESQKRRPLHSR